ncbi:ABC transporter C member 13, partial [Coemansia sp. RSA 355]
ALYLKADVYVFDDLLSAVDAHVERHIIENVLVAGGIISSKTRILVTHAEHVIPLSDKVITLTDGQVQAVKQTPVHISGNLEGEKAAQSVVIDVMAQELADIPEPFVIHPDYKNPPLRWTNFKKYIALSGYWTVAAVVAIQLVSTCALFYIDRLRINLMTDSNPDTMSQSLKKLLLINAAVEILSKQLRDFGTWIQKKLWSQTLVLAFKLWQRFGLNMPVSAGEVDIATTMSLNMFSRINRLASLDHSIHGKLKDLERYFLITEQLPREVPVVIETCRPSKHWPSNGQIEFHNYSMQYNPTSSMVLCNMSFAVGCQEKIGIVGRTGAGKSSLVQAIMRMVEPAAGKIIIDGVDIATIGLHDLRSHISIIPQDPTQFYGSIRDNLDPMNEFTDDEVWAAICTTHIEGLLEKPTRKYVEDPDDDDMGVWLEGIGLNKWVEYGGNNFSVGERQLISLCRALLWKRKILVLDEATANIDNKTDQLIQTILRDEFKDCTILTIAHRLNTVMDSDRILVMDQGTVAEFDTPKNLLARDGPFTQLVASMKLNHGELVSNE